MYNKCRFFYVADWNDDFMKLNCLDFLHFHKHTNFYKQMIFIEMIKVYYSKNILLCKSRFSRYYINYKTIKISYCKFVFVLMRKFSFIKEVFLSINNFSLILFFFFEHLFTFHKIIICFYVFDTCF